MVSGMTSYASPTPGTGTIVNDVQMTYNSFGQLITDSQSHSGAVVPGTTPMVQYGYYSGSTNTIRPQTLTYPNGRVLNYNYGTSGGINDSISTIASLIDNDGVTHLTDYSYLGRNAAVIASYAQPSVEYTLYNIAGTNDPVTGDVYTGMDSFGRIKDCRWYNFGNSTDVARLKYGFDNNGNRLWRQDTVAATLGQTYDEFYTYDGLQRLKDMQRGALNANQTGIPSPIFEQCWTLDATNNWSGFRQAATGGLWTLNQSRTSNTVNEITNITNSVGGTWVTPAYDAAGNTTSMPQPANPGNSYTATYDAWNRLMTLSSGTTLVQKNQYEARNFRTIRMNYTAGVLSETRQFYYSSSWQSLEEWVSTLSTPERQQVWGLRYVDDLVLRDRNTTGGGTLNERLYGLQDANWNLVALINASATAQERCFYSPFGTPTFLNGTMSAILSSSAINSEILFTGQRFDSSTNFHLFRNRFYDPMTGRFVSRDPLGYPDGPSTYAAWFILSGVDPFGLAETSLSLSPITDVGNRRTCIFTMQNHYDAPDAPFPDETGRLRTETRWERAAYQLKDNLPEGSANVDIKVGNTNDILASIKKFKCCQVVLIGHRGGVDGSIKTYPGKHGLKGVTILPNEQFAKELRDALAANRCNSNPEARCQIFVTACNDPTRAKQIQAVRQTIANLTRCTVCGTVRFIASGATTDSPPYQAVDFDPQTPQPEPRFDCQIPQDEPADVDTMSLGHGP